jgi:ABC-type uncharacterized transport system substrate-binding protein
MAVTTAALHGRFAKIVVYLLLALAAAGSANAHPHVRINMKVEVLFDAAGRITALRDTWLFDEIYTVMVTEDVARDSGGRPTADGLDKFARLAMKNLAAFHYLTRVDSGGTELELALPENPSARMIGNRLEITFKLPLAEPISASERPFAYSIYDPTYYIDMVHAHGQDAIRLVGAPPDCRYELMEPHPDPPKVEEAIALDQTGATDDGLGVFFAERVVVRCDARQ